MLRLETTCQILSNFDFPAQRAPTSDGPVGGHFPPARVLLFKHHCSTSYVWKFEKVGPASGEHLGFGTWRWTSKSGLNSKFGRNSDFSENRGVRPPIGGPLAAAIFLNIETLDVPLGINISTHPCPSGKIAETRNECSNSEQFRFFGAKGRDFGRSNWTPISPCTRITLQASLLYELCLEV